MCTSDGEGNKVGGCLVCYIKGYPIYSCSTRPPPLSFLQVWAPTIRRMTGHPLGHITPPLLLLLECGHEGMVKGTELLLPHCVVVVVVVGGYGVCTGGGVPHATLCPLVVVVVQHIEGKGRGEHLLLEVDRLCVLEETQGMI